ncbi:MAG: 50S ribosomal protein L18 [Candidatus Moranbacteria bacterium GW2011_GWE1_36_7]|nr:MAG: 50S ribosomal protein L18 [Candidatus Moranbacteria bacterium GW2011_GWD2_36_12]KKQ06262.1 MAG: 50S ribosomal protein L18 [Candidatus Moranbacteria bacterium GW2011_GWE2_36_40]KKQ12320.1 MAG: 50S ribosomal protein L18 [Candidatus Moranbacteria bacterium GW2011_GWE1_36_7]
MNKLSSNSGRIQRKRRVRAKISGTASRPRLAVFKSLKSIYAQVIDDTIGKTLASAKLSDLKKASNTVDGAKQVGKLIAEKCIALKIVSVTYDRAGYRYHGKVKALAEGAREGGLQF